MAAQAYPNNGRPLEMVARAWSGAIRMLEIPVRALPPDCSENARVCPGIARALEMAAWACPGAARALEMAARRCVVLRRLEFL